MLVVTQKGGVGNSPAIMRRNRSSPGDDKQHVAGHRPHGPRLFGHLNTSKEGEFVASIRVDRCDDAP